MRRSCRILVSPSLALAVTLVVAAATPTRVAAHAPTTVSIAELTRRIGDHPANPALHLERGDLRRVARDLVGAQADYAEVARLAPGHPGLRVAEATLALDTGEHAMARELLAAELAAHPADAHALRLRARALVALGERRAAISDLDAAIALTSRPHPDLFLERARLQVAEQDHAGARAGLDQARSRLGSIASLELFAIELDLADGRPTAASERLEALGAQYPDSEPLAGLAARVAAAGGERADRARSRPQAVAARAVDRGRSGTDGISASSVIPTMTRGPYLQVGTTNAITVRWRTNSQSDSRVRYGTSPGALTQSVLDAATTTEHVVRLTGLLPGKRYYYSVGTSTDVIAGDTTYTFRTAPTIHSSAPVRAWVIGDSGDPSTEAFAVRDAYAAWTGTRGTDLWLMLGDNAYSRGDDSEYQAAVFNQYPLMLRQAVLWPTRGNHDELHGGANNDYYEIFTMPTAGEAGGLASGTEAYYSYDWGSIHFICLDSEGSNRSSGSAMLTWLASDLAANTRPWTIAYWHHPPYSKGSHNSDSDGTLQEMRQNAVPILEAGGVDLVLSGHSHSYERSFLIDGHYGSSSTLGVAMVVDGGDGRVNGTGAYEKPTDLRTPHAGAVYAVAGSSSRTGSGPLNHPVMVSSMRVNGSMVLDVEGNRLDARFLDQTGAVLDSFTIIKSGSVGVRGPSPTVRGLRLGPGVPNPFTRDIELSFAQDVAGHVRLSVHDATGRLVTRLVDGWSEAGTHPARWDGRDGLGRPLPTGVYLVVVEAHGERLSRKIAHVR